MMVALRDDIASWTGLLLEQPASVVDQILITGSQADFEHVIVAALGKQSAIDSVWGPSEVQPWERSSRRQASFRGPSPGTVCDS